MNFKHLALLLATSAPVLHAQWTAPTAEELAMTSIPQVPGAPAVFLYKEQTSDDAFNMKSFYVRIKVLTEGGKEYADVELPYYVGAGSLGIDSIAGRTIHPDGTIIPFTGKPYDKLEAKFGGVTRKEKVFTLPDVQVGSIIEYRYKFRMDDRRFVSPDWFIQSALFTRKAHYMWRPTPMLLTSEDGRTSSSSVAWTPVLPAGAEIKQTPLHINASGPSSQSYIQLDLDVHDVPPIPHEDNMPPVNSLSYRVLFYYTDVKTPAEFWKQAGKRWSKAQDKFIGPGNGVRTAVNSLVLPSDSPDAKLRKIYSAVMALENTDFTREHTASEEKAAGLKEATNTDDILLRKRGTGDQLARLFVAMARAAGLKAYMISVSDRNERIFLPAYLNTRQLDDDLAVVDVNGTERFFDPGQRFCSFGQLAWNHTYTYGLRQTATGTEVARVPASIYKEEVTKRVADLTLDESGVATGNVTLTSTGNAALQWRQRALRSDDTALNSRLRSQLESMLPSGMEVRVTDVEGLTDGEKPLVVHYAIKGALGSSTGKRLLVPADIFEFNSKPRFVAASRDLPVDMKYPSMIQDAVRFKFPTSVTIESTPPPEKQVFTDAAAFDSYSKAGPNSITFFRNITNGITYYLPTSYPNLRTFYNKVEASDQQSLVLTRSVATASN